jgi:hypothetical protein
MPDGLPPALWDANAGKVNEPEAIKSVIELSKFKSEHDARLAAVPEKPEGYKLELPQDFEVPAGAKITFDEKDPRMVAARAWAKEAGLDQGQFSKLLTLEAQRTVGEYKAALANIESEQKKLGEKFPERERALTAFVSTTLTGTAEQKAAKHQALQMVLTSAAAFEALEDIINKTAGSRVPGAGPQDPPKPPEQPLTDRWYGSQQKAS